MSTPESTTHPGTKKAKLSKAWLINLFLLGTFAISWAIPTDLQLLPAAVNPLPIAVGDYIGKLNPDTELEEEVLASDAKITKSDYTDRQGNQVQVSLVLSGQDLNNSIHRPERCLVSQGHREIQHSSATLELPNGKKLPISRLQSKRDVVIDDEKTTIYYSTIYWFVGHNSVTASHYKRSLTDIRDRLIKGTAQQWAYVNISIPSLKDNVEQTSEHIQSFTKVLAPLLTNTKILAK